MNRLVKVINAKNEETSYTYDLNGNISPRRTAKGISLMSTTAPIW